MLNTEPLSGSMMLNAIELVPTERTMVTPPWPRTLLASSALMGSIESNPNEVRSAALTMVLPSKARLAKMNFFIQTSLIKKGISIARNIRLVAVTLIALCFVQ